MVYDTKLLLEVLFRGGITHTTEGQVAQETILEALVEAALKSLSKCVLEALVESPAKGIVEALVAGRSSVVALPEDRFAEA